MDDARRRIAETEAIDAMRKVHGPFIEERCDVNVAAGKVQTLAGRYVEVAGHFVQCQRAVQAARIKRPIRLVCALGQIVGSLLVAFVENVLENETLRNTATTITTKIMNRCYDVAECVRMCSNRGKQTTIERSHLTASTHA